VCEFYIKKGAEVICYDNMAKYELTRTGYAVETARNYNWDLLKDMGVNMATADMRDFDMLLKLSDGCKGGIH